MLTREDWLRYMGWDWYTYATPQEIEQWTPYVQGLVARQEAADAAQAAYEAGQQARIDAYDERAAMIQYDATGRATQASIAAEQAYAAQVYAQAAAQSLIEQNAPAQALEYLQDSKNLIQIALVNEGAALSTGAPIVVMTEEKAQQMAIAAEAEIAEQARKDAERLIREGQIASQAAATATAQAQAKIDADAKQARKMIVDVRNDLTRLDTQTAAPTGNLAPLLLAAGAFLLFGG